jgi:hypothetical protein
LNTAAPVFGVGWCDLLWHQATAGHGTLLFALASMVLLFGDPPKHWATICLPKCIKDAGLLNIALNLQHHHLCTLFNFRYCLLKPTNFLAVDFHILSIGLCHNASGNRRERISAKRPC